MDWLLNYVEDAILDAASTIPGAAFLFFTATLICIMGILMLASVGALWTLPVFVVGSFLVAIVQWDTHIVIRRPVIRIYVDINPTPQYGVA